MDLEQSGPVVVAAHSLGCIATTHLPPEVATKIQDAFLVAPADSERRGILAGFGPWPLGLALLQSLGVGLTAIASSPESLLI